MTWLIWILVSPLFILPIVSAAMMIYMPLSWIYNWISGNGGRVHSEEEIRRILGRR